MNPHQLAREAEDIRKKIKGMIPETAMNQNEDVAAKASILSEDKDGNKTYGGLLLTEQISLLTEHMKIGEGWGWNLVHFSKPKQVINDRRRMYLVPLSENTSITPGGLLEEGFYAYFTNQPWLNSNATVIVIIPV